MTLHDFIFGRLTTGAFPHNDVALFGALTVVVGIIGVLGAITFFGRWRWVWKEYFTSLDAKRIGVLYLIVSGVMLARGGMDALLLRIQQATSVGAGERHRRCRSLPADLLRARLHHDLLRRDGVHVRHHQPRACRCRSARATSRSPSSTQ